jgi:hypothetical protein
MAYDVTYGYSNLMCSLIISPTIGIILTREDEMGPYTGCSRIRFADITLTLQRNSSLFISNNQLKVTMRSFRKFSNCGPSC